MRLNPPPSRLHLLSVLASCFTKQPLLLINANEAEVGRGRSEVLGRNRRFEKDREEHCILPRTEEKREERKETGQGELFH